MSPIVNKAVSLLGLLLFRDFRCQSQDEKEDTSGLQKLGHHGNVRNVREHFRGGVQLDDDAHDEKKESPERKQAVSSLQTHTHTQEEGMSETAEARADGEAEGELTPSTTRLTTGGIARMLEIATRNWLDSATVVTRPLNARRRRVGASELINRPHAPSKNVGMASVRRRPFTPIWRTAKEK